MKHFSSNPDSGVTSPNQVAIVGDRLLTDVVMANMMGSYGIWVKDGVKESGKAPNLVC
jgi:phosphatidylglycerophosphatase GEP4